MLATLDPFGMSYVSTVPTSFLCYRLRTGANFLTHRVLRCTIYTRTFSFFFLKPAHRVPPPKILATLNIHTCCIHTCPCPPHHDAFNPAHTFSHVNIALHCTRHTCFSCDQLFRSLPRSHHHTPLLKHIIYSDLTPWVVNDLLPSHISDHYDNTNVTEAEHCLKTIVHWSNFTVLLRFRHTQMLLAYTIRIKSNSSALFSTMIRARKRCKQYNFALPPIPRHHV